MSAHADKTQENKSQSGANDIVHKNKENEPALQFLDNRSETIIYQKMQGMANNSPQSKKTAQLQANTVDTGSDVNLPQKIGNNKHLGKKYNPEIQVIQGYFVIQPGNIQAEKHASFQTQGIQKIRYGSTYTATKYQTTQHGVNPNTQVATTEINSQNQNVVNSQLPSFRVSTNGLLAVLNEGQPKNFYAPANAVVVANTKLSEAGARVRLKTEGHGVVVPDDPGNIGNGQTRRLKKVHAATVVPGNLLGQVQTQIAQTLPAMDCNNFIRLVMGAAANGSRMGVLVHNGDINSEKEIRAEEGREPIKDVAYHITKPRSPGPTRLKNKLEHQVLSEPMREAGEVDYEKLTIFQKNQRSRKVGINEYAVPDVGEGLVIRSMDTEELLNQQQNQIPQIVPQGTNTKSKRKRLRKKYTSIIQQLNQANGVLNGIRRNIPARIQNLMKTWGEHYAGVVARDGSDYITLENYNRRVEIRWEHERIFNNLFEDFQDFRNLVSARVDSLQSTPSETDIQQLVNLAQNQSGLLSVQYQQALADATVSFQTGLALNNQTAYGSFFFQMYGPGNQSFHSAYKGLASNAMTMRIRETIGPVAQETATAINNLQTNIQNWGQAINQNNVQNLTPLLQGNIQTANMVLQQAQLDNIQAQTRGAYKEIDHNVTNAVVALRTGIQDHLRQSYHTITGQVIPGGVFGVNGFHGQISNFLATYYWFQKFGARYNNSLAYQQLTYALSQVGL